MKPINRSALFFTALILVSFSGCRIKAPTLQEQQALAEKGAFGASTPAWVARQARSSSGVGQSSSGGFLSISAPEARSATPTTEQKIETRVARANTRPTEESLSPMEKLTNECQGLDSQINEALTTVDDIERIGKYEQLVAKCSSSEQLLLWLAEDYLMLRDFAEARKTVNRILVINSGNQEAAELMRKINSEQQ